MNIKADSLQEPIFCIHLRVYNKTSHDNRYPQQLVCLSFLQVFFSGNTRFKIINLFILSLFLRPAQEYVCYMTAISIIMGRARGKPTAIPALLEGFPSCHPRGSQQVLANFTETGLPGNITQCAQPTVPPPDLDGLMQACQGVFSLHVV